MNTYNRFGASLISLASLLMMSCASSAQTTGIPIDQSNLKMTINDGFESSSVLKYDWPEIEIGTGQYEDGPTGVTVIRFKNRVLSAVDVRGGGPGTVNAAFLDLGYTMPETDAVVLSGGSWYGLETVTAVTSALKESGERNSRWDNIALAVGSIVYDLGGRRLNEIVPDKRLAQAAFKATKTGVVPLGAYGAGRFTKTGGIFGCNAHSGQGAAFRQIGDLKILVIVVPNAMGVITDRDGRVKACYAGNNWQQTVEAGNLKASYLMQAVPNSVRPNWDAQETAGSERKNTTISLMVTNRKLDPALLRRVAVQVHTSMARAIQPFATEMDGDVLYAVTTGEIDGSADEGVTSIEIGTIASELMWDALLSAMPVQPQLPEASKTAVNVDIKSLKRVEGEYAFIENVSLELKVHDGKLTARAIGDKNIYAISREKYVELTPLSQTSFFVPGRYPLYFEINGDQLVLNPGRWQQVAQLKKH